MKQRFPLIPVCLILLALSQGYAATTACAVESIDNSLEHGVAADPILHSSNKSPELPAGAGTAATLTIDTGKKYQTMSGVGAAFSEIGGLALAGLSEKSREAVITSLFDPEQGAGFSMCRLPVGASDFATNAYSYAETPGDLGMSHFSLERDEHSIIPAAQAALKKNPSLRFFASPWSPPGWMKTTGRMDGGGKTNNLLDTEEIYNAYTLYYEKYLRGYAAHGITISRLCPQNEMDASPGYPGCVMPPAQMVRLVAGHLAPAFRRDGIPTEIWAGTFREKPAVPWAAECLKDDAFRKAISGLGIQYYDGHSIKALAEAYPSLRFMYTEATCCGGKNTAAEAQAHFREILGAFLIGCDAFAYWNMLLDENQKSGWGWHQNSLVTIDRPTGSVRYNPDYQPLYLVSRLVRPGDIRVDASWSGKRDGRISSQAAAFLKPDGSIAALLQNTGGDPLSVEVIVDGKSYKVEVPGIPTLASAFRSNLKIMPAFRQFRLGVSSLSQPGCASKAAARKENRRKSPQLNMDMKPNGKSRFKQVIKFAKASLCTIEITQRLP